MQNHYMLCPSRTIKTNSSSLTNPVKKFLHLTITLFGRAFLFEARCSEAATASETDCREAASNCGARGKDADGGECAAIPAAEKMVVDDKVGGIQSPNAMTFATTPLEGSVF